MARILSYLAAFIGLSPAIAPALGGIIQQTMGFSAIFVFLLIFTITLFYLAQFHFVETHHDKHLHHFSLKNISKKYQCVLVSKIFWANIIASGCALSTLVICAIVNPFLLQNMLHMTPAHYGFWALIAMLGIFCGLFINGYLVTKLASRHMPMLGILMILLSGIAFVTFSLYGILSIASVVIPAFIISMGCAFILPNAIVGAFTPFPKMAGTVGAVYYSGPHI